MIVTMSLDEWQRVLSILAQAPWAAANPLIMAIGDQLRAQSGAQPGAVSDHAPNPGRGNSGDPGHA